MNYEDKLRHELETIRRKHKGILNPKDVVQFARNSDTALHQEFEWNDKIAGDAYRILQAREVIRTRVTVLRPNTEPVRAYVSLPNDRKRDGGYREINEVLANDTWREQSLRRVDKNACVQAKVQPSGITSVFAARMPLSKHANARRTLSVFRAAPVGSQSVDAQATRS